MSTYKRLKPIIEKSNDSKTLSNFSTILDKEQNSTTKKKRQLEDTSAIQTLFTDKIFRFYYLKTFNSTNYEEFKDFPENEKVLFLINLFLFVSKKRENPASNNGEIFFNNFATRYVSNFQQKTENMKEQEKLHSPKISNQKFNTSNQQEPLRRSPINFNTHANARFSFANTINTMERTETVEITEIKENFKNILKKYTPVITVTNDLNTKELQGMINNIENTILKNSNVFENYIKENNESVNNNLMNSRNIIRINETHKLNEALFYSNFQNNNHSTFHKGDFNKTLKIKQIPENLSILNENFYEFDNLEIFMEYGDVSIIILQSESNELFPYVYDHNVKYKKLRDKNKKCHVNKANFVMFNECEENMMINPSKKNFIRRTVFSGKPKSFVKNLIISVDPITEETELNSLRNKRKTYECDDIIDKIYSCPNDHLANFDGNELNKVGILLIAYVRMEAAYENLKQVSQTTFIELNTKIEEDSKSYQEEKEKLLKEIGYLKENQQKKFDLVYQYFNNLRNKIEFCQKLTNYEESMELDESKLAEAVNKNLDLLSRSEIRFIKEKDQNLSDLNINFNILTNLDIRDDEMTHGTSIKSADNFTKLLQNKRNIKN